MKQPGATLLPLLLLTAAATAQHPHHPLFAHQIASARDAPINARDASPTLGGDMDVFALPGPVTTALPSAVRSRPDHPLTPLGVSAATRRAAGPLQTNKFYANLMLQQQNLPVYVQPYSLSWAAGRTPTGSWGLAVSYVTPDRRVFGPANGPCHHHSNPNAYFYSPPLGQDIVLDAAELGNSTALTLEDPTDLSVLVSLRPGGASGAPAVQFPLVQGQGFVTGLYNGSRPVLRTANPIVGVDTVAGGHTNTSMIKDGVQRFVVRLNDTSVWLVYARSLPGTAPLGLRQTAATALSTGGAFYGSLQVARILHTGQWPTYDRAAGVFATGVSLSGRVSAQGTSGSYSFAFNKADVAGDAAFQASTPLLMFALAHHVASFDSRTQAAVQTGIKLETPTKGAARAVLADTWTMAEPALAADMAFLPWNPQTRRTADAGSLPISASVRQTIAAAARRELAQDMDAATDQESTYYAGKALAKYAGVVLAAAEVARDAGTAAAGLAKLKTCFARFAENRQKHPLVYEGTWGGVVSTFSYTTGDPNVDFGNAYYNDHHFHYGYFVYAAAAIAHLDAAWLQANNGANKAFVDMLVRDYANPSRADSLFPVSRAFDWFHGHSWATGVFPSVDGKNQESSSEDAMAAYALKVWGRATGDARLEARGSLMLAVLARSLQTYYYYANAPGAPAPAEPAAFVGNQVGGILYENKIDHTTFFGARPEFIHGIHMLPLLPSSPLCRPPAFVLQEWNDTFAGGRAAQAQGGWRGVVYGNLATADARTAYAFFAQSAFDDAWLDGGASRTWYLSYAAILAAS